MNKDLLKLIDNVVDVCKHCKVVTTKTYFEDSVFTIENTKGSTFIDITFNLNTELIRIAYTPNGSSVNTEEIKMSLEVNYTKELDTILPMMVRQLIK